MNSILNENKKKFSSLLERTSELLNKIYSFPECQSLLFPEGRIRDSIDPSETLWKCFRESRILCQLYNRLGPKKLISIPEPEAVSTSNGAKKFIYQFITSLKEEIKITDDKLFSISELYKDNTNEFLKVFIYINIGS